MALPTKAQVRDIPFAGVDLNIKEMEAVARVLASPWLAAGPEVHAFEEEFATFCETKYAVCVNSGSSGLLLALKALQLPPHSKVLTAAAGFPATLAPILHWGLEPVFVDYRLPSHNIDTTQCIEQISQNSDIRALIFAHTLGNPVDMASLLDVCQQREVAVIEDCCEAVGATYHGRQVGKLGTMGIFSFYPSHQMTALGGGGMVVTDDEHLVTRLRSLRDWGKRYDTSSYRMTHVQTQYDTPILGESFPYYWGYVYDAVGFNMKLPDANAAFGREQLKKLPDWIHTRRQHFERLQQMAHRWDDHWIPIESPPNCHPSWFGFPITLRTTNYDARLRDELGNYLETHGIRHRPFFAGNILRQPAYRGLDQPALFPVADHLMHNSLFVGVWHKLTDDQVGYMEDTLTSWMASR